MKFRGFIGYAVTTETAPGVHKVGITERACSGEVLRDTKRWENGENLNDNVVLSNTFSIVADTFATENLGSIRYVKWRGTCWRVTSYEVRRPRVILSVGGVWNG